MFRVKVNTPHSFGAHSVHDDDHLFADLEQVRTYLNTNYFHGLDIVKRNTLYSLTSRPETLKNCPYKNFISIEKINKRDMEPPK